jgi:hypothetical protein
VAKVAAYTYAFLLRQQDVRKTSGPDEVTVGVNLATDI